VPSFSVLTALLLNPRLQVSTALGRMRARPGAVQRCLLYAVSLS
jgi:hypothetical protein